MIQQIVEWLGLIGLPGLFIVMALEGSSLPIPGIILVLSFGYILSPDLLSMAFIAAVMAICYSIASLIPYFIGMKSGDLLPKRFEKGIIRGKQFFNRYGKWSIAISRPFGIGNYISYVAGISKVRLLQYLTLTFLGIYPWSFIMLYLGNYFNGNVEAVQAFFSSYSLYAYIVLLVVVSLISAFYYRRFKNKEKSLVGRRGNV
ncbi:VTT domain-containing protein [Bacillus luteolus]|uniref:VTT domain-containing protein n=1 Tax=Litchfieldia luteola TaxID=682179 RepID=A0ABR9QEJ9_9BACI|nr:VTT domain-containing protein [Cytobacillus luteolus]MBE4906924.1 VTT domain-containing protein [Cytobacillus luteolus]MBP1943613.1 membrane protein DedA with SNARE-associated domain [Cytobacillus luteolus]